MAKKARKKPPPGSRSPRGGDRDSSRQSEPKKSIRRKPEPGSASRTDGSPASNRRRRKRTLAIVGMGASAGGLTAINKFFDAMPADSGMAFVLVQHLDPTHQSLSAELIGRHTSMRVVEVTDEMPVEANHVYVIPPNRYLTITDKTLHLTEPLERRGLRVPIDFFFRSLAQTRQEEAIGIVLSGTGSDGTLGVREIKAAGGVVLVQSPETCQFDGMPRSAINSGVVDQVLSVEKMPTSLIDYVRHRTSNGGVAEPIPIDQTGPEQMTTVVSILRARLKHDFSFYKKGTLIRRIRRRMGLCHIDDLARYIDLLRREQSEVVALYKDLLISVTNFFRDPPVWKELTEQVIAPLLAEADPQGTLRVWVPGCATGEEAYSIAMLFIEQIYAAGKGCHVQLFASDIDRDALAIARAGIYPENIVADVSTERFRRFFVKDEGGYRINKDLREMVVFAEQNVISDPPFSKLDLISCRNLLIYLEPSIQKKILSLFHFALWPGGYLLLGGSETINNQHDLFVAVSRKSRIYRRIGQARVERIEFPLKAVSEARPAAEHGLKEGERSRRAANLAQHLVLDRYAPACVLINSQSEVLYLHGDVDRYLQLPSGELAADLMAMAREGLRGKLRSVVHEARHGDRPAHTTISRFKMEGKYSAVRVSAEPVRHGRDPEQLILISFEEEGRAYHRPSPERLEAAAAPGPEDEADQTAIVEKLEEELRGTRGELQSTIEELQTSNEEFQAANEEVTSVNEELQSTNEELETSKEELQSLNEELQTVNSQLEQKVFELETANDDLANLLSSTEIATVFLDQDSRIKRFTPSVTRLLRVIETDVGRPIGDFTWNFSDPDLLDDCATVLRKLAPIEKEIQDNEGRSYSRRIVPYRTDDDRIAGVVVTFIDVTERHDHARELERLNAQLEERVAERTEQVEQRSRELVEKQNLLEAMLDSTTESVVVIDKQGRYLFFNPAAKEIFGFDPADRPGAHWPEHYGNVTTPDGAPIPVDGLPAVRALRGEAVRDVELRIRADKQGDGRLVLVHSGPLRNAAGEVVGAVSIGHDITMQKRFARERAHLAAVMQDPSAAICIASMDGTIMAWNLGAERLLGHNASEIVGQNISIILPSDRRDEFDRTRDQLLRTRTSESSETVRLHKEGTRIDVATTASLVNTGEDNIEGLCIVARDIRGRKRVEHQMAALAESERQRIGQELHDSLGQQMTAIGMIVSTVKEQLGSRPEHASMEKLEQLVEETKSQLRAVARGLVPVDLDAAGLRVALAELATEIRQVHKIDCRLECPDTIAVPDSLVSTQLYLIAREAIHNAVKHAKAREIVVRVENGDQLRLSVRDNGVGIDSRLETPTGMGIHIMRHRAGLIGAALRIEPADGSGTLVTCSLPEPAAPKAKHEGRRTRRKGEGEG